MDPSPPSVPTPEDSHLLLVDVQERLLPVVAGAEALEERLRVLITGARALDVPVLVSEQYPKGLGATVAGLQEALGGFEPVAKTSFSGFGEPGWVAALRAERRSTLVVSGIETHVCILQTALDALAEGYAVHVVADAVASRDPAARGRALERLARAGAVLTDVETVLMEWLRDARHPRFKAVQGLIK